MKSKDLITEAKKKFEEVFLNAIKLGDEQSLANAIAGYAESLQSAYLEEAREINTDRSVLASRGVRVLTNEESKFYNALIEAMSAPNVKNAVSNINIALPDSVIDAVLEDIESEFPLLAEIDFVNTTAITKYLYNAQDAQNAKWGSLGSKITEELNGSIKAINVTMCKLTAFMAVSKDFLKLGPAWLDRYVRAILAEANGLAIEKAVVDGDGSVGPIGMTRNLEAGSTSEGVTTYTRKSATPVTDLSPETYGSIIGSLAVAPSGRPRAVKEVIMLVNPADYLVKIMPATTILTPQGTYVSDVLPFPTKVIQSVAVPQNNAVVGIAKRYFMGIGTAKEGFIEYDDSVQFLDDNRVYTTHMYGNGQPKDNKAFTLIDISNLKPLRYAVNSADSAQG